MKFCQMKHLRVLIFHQNKDRRSKDQNKNKFHFISPAVETNVNRILFMGKQIEFRKKKYHALINT